MIYKEIRKTKNSMFTAIKNMVNFWNGFKAGRDIDCVPLLNTNFV